MEGLAGVLTEGEPLLELAEAGRLWALIEHEEAERLGLLWGGNVPARMVGRSAERRGMNGLDASLCAFGIGWHLMYPDQFSNQTMCFGGVSRGVERCFAQHYLLMTTGKTAMQTAWLYSRWKSKCLPINNWDDALPPGADVLIRRASGHVRTGLSGS